MTEAVVRSEESSLSEFWSFTRDFKSVTAWVAKAAIAAPLADLLLNVGPPWPSRLAVAVLVCVVEVLVLMYSFEFWRRKHAPVKRVQRVMQFGVLGVAVAFCVYIWLFASYVEDAPNGRNRVVVGTTYHDDIADLVRSNPRLYTAKELLDRFEREPTNIWTESSVSRMRIIVLMGWVFFWVTLSTVVASFVALQWRRR